MVGRFCLNATLIAGFRTGISDADLRWACYEGMPGDVSKEMHACLVGIVFFMFHSDD
jgi:hypothetical protein